MKENVDKYLDDLTKKVIKGASMERPSFDFTNAVMSQVETLNESKAIIYKPLISKKGWTFILIVFLSLMAYLVFGIEGTPSSSSLLDSIDFSVLSDNKVTNTLASFKMPKTLVYAIVLFGLMLCIQIPFLKHHFNQRLEH